MVKMIRKYVCFLQDLWLMNHYILMGVDQTLGMGASLNMTHISTKSGWRNTALVFGACCLVIGLPTFFLIARYWLRFTSIENAAWLFNLVYIVLVGVVVAWVMRLLRTENLTLADIGWRQPTRRLAIVLAIAFGIFWAGFGISGYYYFNFILRQTKGAMGLDQVNVLRLVAPLLGVIIAVGEEVICRGYVMSQLHRSGVPAWLQICISGFIFGFYHSLGNFSLQSFLPSVFFGLALAGLYILGKRSLTPSILAHGLINLLGEPFLVMSLLAGYAVR